LGENDGASVIYYSRVLHSVLKGQ